MSEANTLLQLLQLNEDNLSKQKLLHMISIKTTVSCGSMLALNQASRSLFPEAERTPQWYSLIYPQISPSFLKCQEMPIICKKKKNFLNTGQ